MKTSVIDVHDMLSVLSVDDVEQRIGEVPGVKSVTVNYAAGSATVRYDETRLEVADIKSAVRQRGYESAAPAAASAGDGHEGHTALSAPPVTPAPSAAPKTAPVAPAGDQVRAQLRARFGCAGSQARIGGPAASCRSCYSGRWSPPWLALPRLVDELRRSPRGISSSREYADLLANGNRDGDKEQGNPQTTQRLSGGTRLGRETRHRRQIRRLRTSRSVPLCMNHQGVDLSSRLLGA